MRFFILLKIFIMFSTMAMADIYLKPNLRTQGQELSQKFSFYNKFSKTVNQAGIKKYCEMPPTLAESYLKELKKTAEVVPLDAYHYGLIVGFAECFKRDLDDASYYLEMASHDDIAEASFAMGIISLERKAVNAAKRYFTLAAKDNHAEAYYNLGLLESKNLKQINKRTIDLLKNASMAGNLKAQHDYAIIMLKLFLNSRIGLQKSEIIHFQNVFNTIISHTNDTALKSKAEKNLENLMTLRTNFIIARNIYSTPTTPTDTKNPALPPKPMPLHKPQKRIVFGKFEEQGLAEFERYIEYENKLFSGS